MILSSIIEEVDQEIYVYGFFIVLSLFNFFAEALLFGVLCKVIWESLVFFALFSTIRGYAGGIHARKESTCFICTTFAILSSTYTISLLKKMDGCTLQLIIALLGSIAVFAFAPLDSDEKPLSDNERYQYRCLSRVIVVALIMVFLCGYIWNIPGLYNASSVSLFLEGILLIAGAIRNKCAGRKKVHRVHIT